ncbi:MAG: radical SAM protein [Planctomycetes bacterium]|nr:radical SAM protein [Planctomycetota bacterium]
MKLLLSMPYMAFDETKYLSSDDSAFPIGLGYVASALEGAGHNVHVFDFQVKDNTVPKFKKYIKSKSFNIIGFSVTTITKTNVLKLSKICKDILPNCIIIVGGAFPTVYPKNLISESSSVDYEVTGEGEITIVELIEVIKQSKDVNEVRGIVYRNEIDQAIQTPPRPLIEGLDSIPFPAHHLFDLDAYQPPPGMFFRRPLRHMITTRGCPFRCVFCDDRVVWRGRCRMRSAENIIEEMEVLVNKYGSKEIHLYDDTFTVNKERVFRLCELLREKRLGVIWRCSSRVDTVTEKMLKDMYSAGCRSISYGIESGDDEILRKMNKKTNVSQARNAVKWTNRAKIQAKGFFMMNFPGETKETTEKTIALSKELDLDFAGFNLTIPHHGEQLKNMIEEEYQLNEKAYYDSDSKLGNEIYFFQPGLSPEYLKQAYSRAAREFYFRPSYIIKMISRIRNFEMLKSYVSGFRRLLKIKV